MSFASQLDRLCGFLKKENIFGNYLYKTITFILHNLLYFKSLILSNFFGHFEPILGQFVLFFGVGVGSRIEFGPTHLDISSL